MKCKEGYKLKEGKCVKKGISEDLNPTTERFFGLTRRKKEALFIIALSVLVWLFRPFQECKWYELGCQAGWTVVTPVFLVIAGILFITGIWRFVKNG